MTKPDGDNNTKTGIAKKEINNYLVNQIIKPTPSWTKLPAITKLSYLQVTNPKFIFKRKVGKDKDKNDVYAPYIKIEYYERALNFISNFERGYDIIDKGLEKRDKGMEAWVQLKCYIVLDGVRHEKTVIGAWKGYNNVATSRFDFYKSAVSNGVKVFAKTFGIGADKAIEYKGEIGKVRLGIQLDGRSNIEDLVENISSLPSGETTDE